MTIPRRTAYYVLGIRLHSLINLGTSCILVYLHVRVCRQTRTARESHLPPDSALNIDGYVFHFVPSCVTATDIVIHMFFPKLATSSSLSSTATIKTTSFMNAPSSRSSEIVSRPWAKNRSTSASLKSGLDLQGSLV